MRLGKDADFFYPLGSVFDDAFVDGRSFPFLSFRSPQPGVEEVPGEEGFWKTGDTVVVRLEGIGHDVLRCCAILKRLSRTKETLSRCPRRRAPTSRADWVGLWCTRARRPPRVRPLMRGSLRSCLPLYFHPQKVSSWLIAPFFEARVGWMLLGTCGICHAGPGAKRVLVPRPCDLP